MQIKGAIWNKTNRGQLITIEKPLTVAAVHNLAQVAGQLAVQSSNWKKHFYILTQLDVINENFWSFHNCCYEIQKVQYVPL